MKNLHCNPALLTHVSQNLAQFQVQAQPAKGLKQAAVALTVVDVQDNPAVNNMPFDEAWKPEAALILTRRAAKLRKHAGQWALPGGRIDAGESPEATALRELAEEVDLHLGPENIIGRLDDFTTRSGFVITPVVMWAGPEHRLTPNPAEVASIHRIPLREFMRPDAPLLEQIPESHHPVLRMPVGDAWIAAPTGAMIYQFCQVAILGKQTRVAHYEQPLFAWR